jgi:hypothetical protein
VAEARLASSRRRRYSEWRFQGRGRPNLIYFILRDAHRVECSSPWNVSSRKEWGRLPPDRTRSLIVADAGCGEPRAFWTGGVWLVGWRSGPTKEL